MKNTISYAVKSALYSVAILALFISCANSVSSDKHDDHKAAGFKLTMNGQTVIEQLPNGTLTGSFSLNEGEETPLISIQFIAEDGDTFTPEGNEYSLKSTFSVDTIAEFEQHSEDGAWSFHIHGKKAGSTNMTLQLFHNDHSDFNTQPISIQVNAITTK